MEANFRREIGPHARAFPGVRRFIEECHAQGIAMAVASAAIAKNVNFLISALGLRDYFREVLAVDEITHPKPHPEIYLKTAEKLGVDPAACAVFEDSFVGIEAAKRAGMKCVAIASTFSAEDLRRETHADLIVPSFEAVSLQTLRHLFNGAGALPDRALIKPWWPGNRQKSSNVSFSFMPLGVLLSQLIAFLCGITGPGPFSRRHSQDYHKSCL